MSSCSQSAVHVRQSRYKMYKCCAHLLHAITVVGCSAFGSHVLEKVLEVVNSWLLDGGDELSSQVCHFLHSIHTYDDK